MLRQTTIRALAVLAGVALALVAAYGLLFVLIAALVSAEVPTYPDTWADAAVDLGWTLVALVVFMLLVSLAAALLRWGTTRHWPPLKRLALIPGVSLAILVVVLAIVIVPRLDEGWERPDCETFAFNRAAWLGSDFDDRITVAAGVDECGTIAGKTRSQVRALLGDPDTSTNAYWTYPSLNVSFARGRVTTTSIEPPPELD